MTGPRYVFFIAVPDGAGGHTRGAAVAEIYAGLMTKDRYVQMGYGLQKLVGKPLLMVTMPGRKARNPRTEDHRTLVHAGYAQAAQFHVISEHGAPFADLYFGGKLAHRVAQEIADHYGAPLRLVEHTPGRYTVWDEPSRPVRKNPPRRGKRRTNPEGFELGDAVTVQLPYSEAPGVVEKLSRDYVFVRVGADLLKFAPDRVTRRNPRKVISHGRALKMLRQLEAHERHGVKSERKRKRGRNPRTHHHQDALGNGIAVGSVLVGIGLDNAGRAYTVRKLGPQRVQVERHADGKVFWTHPLNYRVDLNANPRARRRNPSRSKGARKKRAGLRALSRQMGRRWTRARRSAAHGRGSAKVAHYFRDQQRRAAESRSPDWPRVRRANPRGIVAEKVPADQLRVGDIVLPPDRELKLWMLRDAAAKGIAPGDLGIMLTEVSEGFADKRGRWLLFKGYLRDAWYQGRKPHPFTFKARPETPWPLLARPQQNPRRNPGQSELERAKDTFRMWHEFDAEQLTPVTVPSRRMPKHLVALGKVRRIDYDSSKWEGRVVTYTHSTKRPYPTLATDPEARTLYLVGGKMKPTADGLVN